MRVKKVMNSKTTSCGPETDLVTAARLMAENGCGALPVVNGGKVSGMITDRDICVALASKGESASSIRVDQVMSTELYGCFSDDNLKSALKTMRRKGVRRLPVFNRDGSIEGILSITDVVLSSGKRAANSGPSYKSILRTYRRIYKHQCSKEGTEVLQPLKQETKVSRASVAALPSQ